MIDLLSNIGKTYSLKTPEKILVGNLKFTAPAGTLMKVMNIDADGIAHRSIVNFKPIEPKKFLDVFRAAVIEQETDFHNRRISGAMKAIDLWNIDPEGFKMEKPADAYHEYPLYLYDKKNAVDYYIATGRGSDTYYTKDYYEKFIKDTENNHRDKLKKINKKPFAKELNDLVITLSGVNISDRIEMIAGVEKTRSLNNSRFPFSVDGDVLNVFVSDADGVDVDDEFIESIRKSHGGDGGKWDEFVENLKKVKGSSITIDKNGFHHHDGQVCDYTVVWTLENGLEYEADNSHSLITGWNFHGTVEFSLSNQVSL